MRDLVDCVLHRPAIGDVAHDAADVPALRGDLLDRLGQRLLTAGEQDDGCPARAKPKAASRPIPREPPVTTTTWASRAAAVRVCAATVLPRDR